MQGIDSLIEQAWERHAEDAPGAAALLEQALSQGVSEASTAQREALLRAAEHVLLAHLDDGPALQRFLQRCDAQASLGATRRAHAAIALAQGELPLWQDLAPAEQIRAHGSAALARCRSRDFDAVRRLKDGARERVRADDPTTGKAWAAMANNIAADLREQHRRGDAPHALLMLESARLARQAWREVGGWLEAERADWQLAMCAAAAGAGDEAMQAAQACLAACQRQGGDDYEFCFAHQAMALAALAAHQRGLAREQREAMAARAARLGEEGNRAYAQRCLAALDAVLS